MPSRPLGSDVVTILVPSVTTDARDNTQYLSYSDGLTVHGCNFQPFMLTQKFQEEFTTERETTRTFFRVYMPALPEVEAITPKHKVRFGGVEYEVHSLIGKWRHFSGLKDHVAFLLKRREG